MLTIKNQAVKPDIHFYNELTLNAKYNWIYVILAFLLCPLFLVLQGFRERFSGIRITVIYKSQILTMIAFSIWWAVNNNFSQNKKLTEQINQEKAETNLGISSCWLLVTSVLFVLLHCLKYVWRSGEIIMLGKQKQLHYINSLTVLSTAHGTDC